VSFSASTVVRNNDAQPFNQPDMPRQAGSCRLSQTLGVMNPSDFKHRYLTHILSNPALASDPELRELRADMCKFATFDPVLLLAYKIDADSARFLTEAGLPLDAAPYMGFDAYTKEEIDRFYKSQLVPTSIFPIGKNNYGDFIGIEIDSGAVVYAIHDGALERVFINSSIDRLAETLCLYQELRDKRCLQDLAANVAAYDAAALEPGAMWLSEAHNDA
jgi:hypothetical protein